MFFKKTISFMLDCAIFLWQLPMNFIGIFCLFFFHPTEKKKMGRVVYYRFGVKRGSISLGRFIFLCDSHWSDVNVQRHEYGHFLQGCILGPLTLLAIGIPSIIWAGCFGKWRKEHKKSYYWFYTENWANKLGKVAQ